MISKKDKIKINLSNILDLSLYINTMQIKPSLTLSIIVFSQFLCTSLWFAGNAVMPELVSNFNFSNHDLAHIISSVQLGFITGTLTFSLLTISDRFSPSKVFFISALLAAFSNLGIIITSEPRLLILLLLRFMTGFFLAGIYPVGMKIASDYFDKELGKALGFLVGALVLGTAFPHLLKSFSRLFFWKIIFSFTSGISFLGGLLILLFVSDGPYRKKSQQLDFKAIFKVFRNKNFRLVIFGYFGHMWELYAFWTFTPIILFTYEKIHPHSTINVPMISFLVIGLGSLSCIGAGFISQKLGSKQTAIGALLLSTICCCLSPFTFFLSESLLISFLIFWGLVVIADSPMFSTLVAQNTAPENKGTALTIVNCIGFSITIISIEFINLLMNFMNNQFVYVILAVGPIIGLLTMLKLKED